MLFENKKKSEIRGIENKNKKSSFGLNIQADLFSILLQYTQTSKFGYRLWSKMKSTAIPPKDTKLYFKCNDELQR